MVGRAISFTLHVRQRWSWNSLAPVCSGIVEPGDSGSTVKFSLGVKPTLFKVFAIVFGLIFTFVVGLGVISTAMRLVVPADGRSPASIVLAYLSFLIPAVVVTVIFAGLFLLGKWMGKIDEKSMVELLHSIFRDVMIHPTRPA